MDTYLVIGTVIVGLFVLIFAKEAYDSKKKYKKIIDKAEASFGHKSDRKYTQDELDNIKHMFYRSMNEDSIDDITAGDLEIDDIFMAYNNCLSAPGSEYFYYRLRNPEYDDKKLEAFEKKVEFVRTDVTSRRLLEKAFLKIGGLRQANFYDCLDFFDNIERKPLIKEYITIALFILSVVLTCINPGQFVFFLVLVLVYNIISYYSARGTIESYVVCMKYIVNFIGCSEELCKSAIPELSDDYAEIFDAVSKLSRLKKRSGLLNSSNATGAGNPVDLIADYLRMFFHVDIIRFYHMLDELNKNRDEIERLYFLLGRLEGYVACASFREAQPSYCIPESGKGIKAVNVYHPMISNPVKNSIDTEKCVLITGSNASGKSTFLKTIALNAIFARTVHICMADSFVLDDYHIFSSMSLRDDLMNEDSYFMVEIKALKRIFDYADANPQKKVLCFVDEVLRGTNTIERIAACTKIMENISGRGIMCFAATHDIELTELLEEEYINYHFDEQILENDIVFNYELKTGRATSRNAIKLLSIMGFSDDIVSRAQDMAERFISEKVWKK